MLNFNVMYCTIFRPQINMIFFFHLFITIDLTINFNLAQITIRKFRVIAWIDNLWSALVVVNDVTSVKRTINSLVLWWRAHIILYFMETKMAVVLWSCIWNIQGKPCHPRCECCWSYWNKWNEQMKIDRLCLVFSMLLL